MTEHRVPDRVWLLLATLGTLGVALLLDALTQFTTGDWLLFLTVPAPWLFVARYSRTRWFATVSGRAIMLKSSGTGLFLTLAVVGTLLPDGYPGRGIIRVLVYGFLFAAQWYLTTLLFRIQRLAPATPAERDTERTDA